MKRWAGGITDIRYVTDLGNTPASVDRTTGVVYINARKIGQLSKDQWLFILLHELGHLELQSRDERAVDEWAFQEYASLGGSLKQSVYALTDTFNFTNLEQLERANLQLDRAKLYDQKNNGKKTKNKGGFQKRHQKTEKRLPLRERRQGSQSEILNQTDMYIPSYVTDDGNLVMQDDMLAASGALGYQNSSDISSTTTFDSPQEYVSPNADPKVKGQFWSALGQGASSFINQGIGILGNKVLGDLGLESQRIQAEANRSATTPIVIQDKGSNTGIWIGAGVGVLVLAVVLFLFLKKR